MVHPSEEAGEGSGVAFPPLRRAGAFMSRNYFFSVIYPNPGAREIIMVPEMGCAGFVWLNCCGALYGYSFFAYLCSLL